MNAAISDASETIQVNAIFSIKLYTTQSGKIAAYLLKATPKGKYANSEIIRSHVFGTEGHRYDWAMRTASQVLEVERTKAKQKADNRMAAKAAASSVKVGAIFSHSYGYDQTNIHFYQVVKVSGQMVEIKELNQRRFDQDWGGGKCVPIPGSFYERGETMRKKIQSYGRSICISMECGSCSLWDGKPEHFTSGH